MKIEMNADQADGGKATDDFPGFRKAAANRQGRREYFMPEDCLTAGRWSAARARFMYSVGGERRELLPRWRI
jgi:hypothetical protein